jgi:antitoxin (DNA-binding transcriptional repressor) of toxin-antitoxin stability system
MATIGLEELPVGVRSRLEQGETLEITDGEAIVARLVPIAAAQPLTDEKRARLDSWFARSDELAKRVSAAWQGDVNAVDAVNEQRREL